MNKTPKMIGKRSENKSHLHSLESLIFQAGLATDNIYCQNQTGIV